MSVHESTTDTGETSGLTSSQKNRAGDLAGRHAFDLHIETRAGQTMSELVFKSVDESTGIVPWTVRVMPVKRGDVNHKTGYTVVKHHAHEQPQKGFVIQQNVLFTRALELADNAMSKLEA